MRNIMAFLKKIKQHGTVGIIKEILAKYLKTRIMKLHYLKAQINYNKSKAEIDNLEFEIKELIYDDFLLGDKTVFNPEKLDLIRERCNDDSYKAYGIISNNILLYSTWISLEKLGLPIKSKFKLYVDEGLLEDSYCHPSARGKGLHSKMNFFRLSKLYELGKTKCVAIVLNGNTPAFKVQFKSGFEELGIFYAGEVLGIPFTTLNKKKYDRR
ncbi:MAG TPA: hypothetical protein P5084_02595 [Paludibacter sp.]|nr:hypothetical protein [Paludibacter sp.]